MRQGYGTFYQSSLKDAFPCINTLTVGSCILSNNGIHGDMSIKNSIQRPEVFYNMNAGWTPYPPAGYPYLNIWSMDNTVTDFNDNPVVKTIYDPCPAGFHIPASNAFTGFTTDGADGPVNASGAWENGWNFNNKITNPDAIIYFPASRCRDCYSYALNGTDDNNYWTALPSGNLGGTFFGCILHFNSSGVRMHINTYGRANGAAVRPVAE